MGRSVGGAVGGFGFVGHWYGGFVAGSLLVDWLVGWRFGEGFRRSH